MKIGFVGLGKMGFNMVHRLLKGGHEVAAFDRNADTVKEAEALGAIPAYNLEALVAALDERKVVWIMVPAGAPVDQTLDQLTGLLAPGDIVVEGGNSFWRDSQARAERLQAHGIHYLDCGTSGGVWGLQNGYCLMYGGPKEAAAIVEPFFKTLAPENGYLYCGESGAGHLVKMVHNGIEYGMMQAYAEGFEIMEKSPFGLDLKAIADLWMQGSVVRSWLLELAGNALEEDPDLSKIRGYVNDSGEGRWTIQTAIDFDVPVHAIAASLFARFTSRQDESFAMKMLAALRNQFGGHAVKSAE